MSRARTLANFGGVTSSATELNLLDGQTDLASQAELDAKPEYNDNVVQTNIALLAFKTAVNGSLAKYNLQDQIVDEYVDATGVNTGDSTNEVLTAGVYGATTTTTATGGTITYYGIYAVHTFLSGGTFTPSSSLDVDYLIVGGGGGGGFGHILNYSSGGGGAGGFRTGTGSSVTAQGYSILVGDGGDGSDAVVNKGDNGDPSSFNSIISAGGGGGGSYTGIGSPGDNSGAAGGSGGGGGITDAGGAATAITPVTGEVTTVQGNAGGTGISNNGGGGGGASAAGTTGGGPGYGGAGENNVMGLSDADSLILLANASAGVVESSASNNRYFAGGGGGSWTAGTIATGGLGGGGSGGKHSGSIAGTDGTDNTGGGGGAGSGSFGGDDDNGRVGGSGIVIIRHTSLDFPLDLTLQSSDTTAEAAPTNADMVMLIEDAGTGVGTINTHIKGWISRYETGGTKTWTQGTLVDEGDWGSDKRILAFHDLTLTGTSGTQMAYKITTHSASAVYNTKVHATSIGWR